MTETLSGLALQKRAQLIRSNFNLSKGLTAEQASQDYKVAQNLGTNPDLVSRQRDDAYERERVNQVLSEVNKTPALAEFISNRHNAAMTKDDIANLVKVSSMGGLERVGYNLAEGTKSTGRNLFGAVRGLFDFLEVQNKTAIENLPEEVKARLAKEKEERKARFEKRGWTLPTGDATQEVKAVAEWAKDMQKSEVLKSENLPRRRGLGGFWDDVVQMAPQIVAQIGSHVVAGPAASMGFMGAQISGGSYTELVDVHGVDTERAFTAAIINAAAQAPLEQIGLTKALKAWKPTKLFSSRIKTVVQAMGTEFTTELLQKYPEAITEIWARAKNEGHSPQEQATLFFKKFGEITAEGAYEGLVASMYGGLTSATGVASESFKNRRDAKKIEQFAAEQLKANEEVNSTKLKERNSDKMKEFLDLQGYDGDSFLTSEGVAVLAQTNIQVLNKIGITEEMIPEIDATGVDTALKLSVLHSKLSPEEFKLVVDHISPDKETPSMSQVRESREIFAVAAEAQIKEAEKIKAEEEIFKEEGQQVYEDIKKLREDTGREVKTAKSDAEYWRAFVESYSDRYSYSPSQVYEKLVPSVKAVEFEGSAEQKKLQEYKEQGAVLKQAENEDPALKVAEEFNQISPEHDLKYDGVMDLSVLNKPNIYQFTAYKGPIKGATFTVESATIKDIKAKIDKMVEAWSGKKDLFQRKDDPRGMYDPELNVISLFEGADASTFLHESGHVFFNFMSVTANSENAPDNLKKDWEALASFVGNDGKSSLTNDQHEQLAEALEAYFMEGKAPSMRLKDTFQRFANWLKRLYKSVSQLDVELNPEIRQLFARMFATDKEIQDLEQYYDSQKPFLKDLNSEQKTKYEGLRSRAELDAKNKRLKKYIDAYIRAAGGEKQLYKEASATVNQMPVYKSMDTAIVGGGFPTHVIDQIVGETDRKKLSKKRVGLVSKKGSVDPDFIARENGYETTEAMFSAMLNSAKKSEMRDKIVIGQLEKIQRDMLDHVENDLPGEEEYHSDSRMKVIAAELQMMKQQESTKKGVETRKTNFLKTKAVRGVAKQALETKMVRDASNFNRFSRAEAKASKLAREAYEKGDLEKAEKHKRQELLNHALVIESIKLRDEIEKGVNQVKKLLKSKTIGQEELDLVNDIAVRFGIKNRPPGTTHEENVKLYYGWLGETDNAGKLRKKIDFNSWENSQTEKGYGVALSWVVKDRSTKTFYKDMKTESFKAVIDSVKQISAIELNERKITVEGKRVDLKKVIKNLKDQMAKTYTPKQQKLFEKNKKSFLNTMDSSLLKMEFLFEALDGGKIGPFHEIIFQKVAESEEKENIQILQANKDVKKLFDKHYTKKEQRDMFSKKHGLIEAIGESPTRAQLIRTFLDFGNADNYAKRRDGNNWTDQQMEAVKNSLDKKDYDFCQEVWNYINSFKDESFALEKRMTGRVPTAVMPEKIETRFGVYDGGYFPITFDSTKNNITESRKQVEEAFLFGLPNYAHAMTKKGHLKERQETAGGQVLSMELTDITRHVAGVIHDITHREAVVDISKIFNDRDMESAFREYLGEDTTRQFMPWLKDIANAAPVVSQGERLAKGIRIGMNVAKLGKFSVMLQQVAGFTQSVHALGRKSKGLPKSFMDMVFNRKQAFDTIAEKSGFMKTRITNYNREAHDAFKGLNVYKKTSQSIGEFAMKGIGVLQYMVDAPTWMTAYEAHKKEGFTEKQSVAFADSIVRKSQGGGGVKDLSRVQRGNEYFKLATMFYSFMNTAYNIFTKSGRGKKFNFKEMSSAILWVGLIGPVAAEILSGRPPEEEKDEEFAAWLAKTEIRFYSGLFPIFRDIAGSAATGFGYRLSPVEQPVDTVIKGVRKAIREEDVAALGKPAAEIGGIAFRMPSDQIFKTAEAFWHWLGGDPDFEAQHLIYGGKYKD